MMNVHADALNEGGALYHEFLLRFRKDHKAVYGIVEGKDDPLFYRGLIEQHLPSGWEVELLIAGNKHKVLRAEKDFDWNRFSRSRICFFVDRDLSDFSEAKEKSLANIYVTDSYSIENELANFSTVRRVIQELLSVADVSHGELLLMERSFNDNVRVFSGDMASIMAQIVLWQRTGGKPSLDNILPKDIFEFSNGLIRARAGFEDVSSRINYAAQKVNLAASAPGDLAIATDEFIKKSGPERLIRGKYVAWFVVEQCLHFHSRIQDYCKFYAAPPKVRVTLGQANAMALVANRIRCPESLERFVKSNYGEYILGPRANVEGNSERASREKMKFWRKTSEIASFLSNKWFRSPFSG
jgi:hypothetical protein